MPEEYKNAWKPGQKTTGILALYYYWCYQLGIFPKGTDYKPTSPFMKEELRKMDGLIDYRRHLQNKIRRALPAEKEVLRSEKRGVTEKITELRKRLKYVRGIEERSVRIDERMNDLYENIQSIQFNRIRKLKEER